MEVTWNHKFVNHIDIYYMIIYIIYIFILYIWMILDKRSLGAFLAFQVSGCDLSSCLAGNFSFSWQGRIYRCGEVCPSLGFWRQLCILKTKPTQKSRVFEVLQLLLWISSTVIWRYMKFVRGRAFWSWIFNREGSSTVQPRPGSVTCRNGSTKAFCKNQVYWIWVCASAVCQN